MKFMKQLGIIFLISFLGEVLKAVLPLPVPASIYGLLLMLVALMTGIVKLEEVRYAGSILIEIMPMMFIPAAAGILVSWPVLKSVLGPIVVITIVTTVLVMGVSASVTQAVNRMGKGGTDERDHQ